MANLQIIRATALLVGVVATVVLFSAYGAGAGFMGLIIASMVTLAAIADGAIDNATRHLPTGSRQRSNTHNTPGD